LKFQWKFQPYFNASEMSWQGFSRIFVPSWYRTLLHTALVLILSGPKNCKMQILLIMSA
jgi:hypothetical protein